MGDDGLEHGADLDVFSEHGQARANITIGVWHPQVDACLKNVFTELCEHGRASLAGPHWLIARQIHTMDVADVAPESSGWPDPSVSVAGMLRDIEPIRSLTTVLGLIGSVAAPNGWRAGSLLGLKILVAQSLNKRDGRETNDEAYRKAIGWIAADEHYAETGVGGIEMVVERAVANR